MHLVLYDAMCNSMISEQTPRVKAIITTREEQKKFLKADSFESIDTHWNDLHKLDLLLLLTKVEKMVEDIIVLANLQCTLTIAFKFKRRQTLGRNNQSNFVFNIIPFERLFPFYLERCFVNKYRESLSRPKG